MRWRHGHSLGLGCLLGLALSQHGLYVFLLGTLVGVVAFWTILNVQRLIGWARALLWRRERGWGG